MEILERRRVAEVRPIELEADAEVVSVADEEEPDSPEPTVDTVEPDDGDTEADNEETEE